MANFKPKKWVLLFFILGAALTMLLLSAVEPFAQSARKPVYRIPEHLSKDIGSIDTIIVLTKKKYVEKSLKEQIADLIFGDNADILPVDTITKITANIFRSQITTKSVKIVESPYIPPKTVLSSDDVYQNTLFVYLDYKYAYARRSFPTPSNPITYDGTQVTILLLRPDASNRTDGKSQIGNDDQGPTTMGYVGTRVNDHKTIQTDVEQKLRKGLQPLSQAINCAHDPLQCK